MAKILNRRNSTGGSSNQIKFEISSDLSDNESVKSAPTEFLMNQDDFVSGGTLVDPVTGKTVENRELT